MKERKRKQGFDASAIKNQVIDELKSLGTGGEEGIIKGLNKIRAQLARLSPLDDPVDLVTWVPLDQVRANAYNPNIVAPPEMELLYQSIKIDGYTQPIVCYRMKDGTYEVVDGFHRNRIAKERKDIKERVRGRLPVVIIDKPLEERMASTIRHNRARGTHQIRPMSELVMELAHMGWDDKEIGEQLGMELDEVLRLKQISGLKKAYKDHVFSKSWEEFERRHYKSIVEGEERAEKLEKTRKGESKGN
ncbi:hypothetical protein GF325_01585 [Candidatus Bathyarchaeota archaeon]|nr:hypothetical protein [Candidatus Bathyarchaeota archaeon]